MKRYLVIGATSAIARACCRAWLGDGEPTDFLLVGRSPDRLEQTAADLRVRGARNVAIHVLDLAEPTAFAGLHTAIQQRLGQVDVALVAHGTLPDQQACERDAVTALREFNLNGSAVIALLTHLANVLEPQGQGVLAVITSVAGDRGRPSNYLYGSAKAAVSAFCEGLRVRLFRAGVHLIEIRPGFVDTPMTEALGLPRPLVATPAQVAGRIVRAIARRRDVLYVPAYWAFILGVIRALPRPVFKRLNL
jgi:decaprenylphospho-beta-D-erythro-pentofuranosid-2-ulose 2-reductase